MFYEQGQHAALTKLGMAQLTLPGMAAAKAPGLLSRIGGALGRGAETAKGYAGRAGQAVSDKAVQGAGAVMDLPLAAKIPLASGAGLAAGMGTGALMGQVFPSTEENPALRARRRSHPTQERLQAFLAAFQGG